TRRSSPPTTAPTPGTTTRCNRSPSRPWRPRSTSRSSSTATPTPTSPPTSSVWRSPTSWRRRATSTRSWPTSKPRSRRTPSSESVPVDLVTIPIDANELTAAPTPRRRRPRSRLTSDKAWLVAMVGVPAFLHIVLVWIPALFTVALSFTEWDNLAPLTDIRAVGFQNYWFIFTVFEGDLFGALF